MKGSAFKDDLGVICAYLAVLKNSPAKGAMSRDIGEQGFLENKLRTGGKNPPTNFPVWTYLLHYAVPM